MSLNRFSHIGKLDAASHAGSDPMAEFFDQAALVAAGWAQANLPKIMRVRQQQVRRSADGDMPM
jgi:hypothetical protein